MSGADLCGLAEVAAEQSRWIILAFHGFQQEPSSGRTLSGTYHASSLPADSFRELCAYLAAPSRPNLDRASGGCCTGDNLLAGRSLT